LEGEIIAVVVLAEISRYGHADFMFIMQLSGD
jgi:hypothetical protein